MSCTNDIILKVVVKIVLCDCDVYPTSYCRMVEGHVIKHHRTFVTMMNTASSGPGSEVENTHHINRVTCKA